MVLDFVSNTLPLSLWQLLLLPPKVSHCFLVLFSFCLVLSGIIIYLEGLLINQRQKGIGREEPKEERTRLRDNYGVLGAEKGLALRNVSETAKLRSGHPSPTASYFPSCWSFLSLHCWTETRPLLQPPQTHTQAHPCWSFGHS